MTITKNNLGVDCVARQDVERFIEGFINEYTPEEEFEFINLELDGLKHLPPVTPQEPRTGHWISHREHCEMNNLLPSGLGSYCWCSECDCGIDSKYFHRAYYNYCPNCGAKME